MNTGTGMNLKACPWTMSLDLVGEKGEFYYFQNFGFGVQTNLSITYHSLVCFSVGDVTNKSKWKVRKIEAIKLDATYLRCRTV
jgi:hypothetical protein